MYFCKHCGAINPRTTKNRKWAEGLPLCWKCKLPVMLILLNGNSMKRGISKEEAEQEHTYTAVYNQREGFYNFKATPVE